MQNVVLAKPYRFVPPRYSAFWTTLVGWRLPSLLRKRFGIASWECVGTERLRASLRERAGVVLASNHCRPCDPMTLGLLSLEAGRHFHVMASWHLFMQGRVQSFLLPRVGAFSVYREGLDRESLRCATRILAEARFPLVLFPEGFVTRNNDRLFPLMEGVSFLARAAAKQRAASPRPGKVVVHPVFVRYFFDGELAATVAPVLRGIESRLSWQHQDDLPLRERILKAGQALLTLKEIERFGQAQSGDATERLARLRDRLLRPLAAEWLGGRLEADPMACIKRLRAAILPDMVHGELAEEEKERRWGQLEDLRVVQQLHCYSGDELAGECSPERLLEIVERYEEDLAGKVNPHPPLHAVISVGEAIAADASRERGSGEEDPLATALRTRLECLMQESKTRRCGNPNPPAP